MILRKYRPFICTFVLFFFVTALYVPAAAQTNSREKTPKHKKIVENVDVTNIAIPVRVFHKGKPVMDLKKEDLRLIVNGKETPVNGFYTIKKMITQTGTKPRLFVLMFNISDYKLPVENILDTFFHKIFRPNDHLIVITRNFIVDEKIVVNPIAEKYKVTKILELEKEKVKHELRNYEQQMKSLLRKFNSRTQRYQHYDQVSTLDFLNNYAALVRQFKTLYLNMDGENQLKLARYLAGRDIEKWVLNFYQVGRFYKPRLGSTLFKTLANGVSTHNTDSDNFKTEEVYEQIREALEPEDKLPSQDLLKEFVKSRATFHTVLMEHQSSVLNEMAGDLTYVPVISDSYNLLKSLSSTTGGYFIDAKDLEVFYNRITAAQDIHYIITFSPPKQRPGNLEKERIRVNITRKDGKKYKVSYDDGKRKKHFQKLIDKQLNNTPDIRIERVDYKGRQLAFVVADFSTAPPKKKTPYPVIKLPVRIQIFNRKAESLFNGVQMFEVSPKQIVRIKGVPKVNLSIVFPQLPLGSYDVFIWVGDPNTGERDLAIEEINVTSQQ